MTSKYGQIRTRDKWDEDTVRSHTGFMVFFGACVCVHACVRGSLPTKERLTQDPLNVIRLEGETGGDGGERGR